MKSKHESEFAPEYRSPQCVSAGADSFEQSPPDLDIPQDAPEYKDTGKALDAFFTQPRRRG